MRLQFIRSSQGPSHYWLKTPKREEEAARRSGMVAVDRFYSALIILVGVGVNERRAGASPTSLSRGKTHLKTHLLESV